VTFNQRDPSSWRDTALAIRTIGEHFAGQLRVGAGTVLRTEQLDLCQQAGGQYMISPSVNLDLIRDCVSRGLVAMPGAMTPTEAVSAFEAGARFIKIFPVGSLGPDYVKSLAAPLSHIPFLAVGGISAANVADYLKAGCVGAGVGGTLTNRAWIEAGEWGKIEAAARQLVLAASCV
jgi:2-dehydro-3-deoxyphosphogluconate aldolase/(4S)-4-hydroxy-2-oxoglutarate aldolase